MSNKESQSRGRAVSIGIFVFLLGFTTLAADIVLFTTDYGISPRFKAGLGAVSACGAALATIVGLIALMRSALPPATEQESRRLLHAGSKAVAGLVAVSALIVWISVQLLPEPQAPAPSPGLAVRATPTSVIIDWIESPDDANIKEYQLYRGDTRITSGRVLNFVDPFVEAGAVYTYRVLAIGSNGLSSTGAEKVAEVPRVLLAPSGVQPLYVAENQVQLTWTIAEGEVPAGFTILRNGVEIGESTTNYYLDTSVTADTGYRYTVRSFSTGKARKSTESAALAVQTQRIGAPPIQNTTIIRQPIQLPPPNQGGPAPAPPSNTASLSLANSSAADYCVPLSGSADLAAGKSILTAHRRVNSPPDTTYYFHRGSLAADAKTWSGREYLGDETGQRYEIYVLVMDAAAADLFWTQHVAADQSYAFADSLPSPATDTKTVTQTTTANCS